MINRLLSVKCMLVPVGVAFLFLMIGCTGQSVQPSPAINVEPTTGSSVPPQSSILFENVAKGYTLGGTLNAPTLLVVDDESSLKKLASMISKKDQSFLNQLDLKNDILVAVFLEVMPSGGTSITIDNVSIKGDELTVNLLVKENDPDFPKIDAATIPYHLIKIDHEALPDNTSLKYRLVADNELLATGEVP